MSSNAQPFASLAESWGKDKTLHVRSRLPSVIYEQPSWHTGQPSAKLWVSPKLGERVFSELAHILSAYKIAI